MSTRAGWTTVESPGQTAEPPPAPSWAWAIVLCVTSAAILLLVYVEAFR